MVSNVRMGVKEVLRHFKQLEDPRSAVNRLHPLDSVVVIAIMAVLAGANGPTAIAKWANMKAKVLLKCWTSRMAFRRKMSSAAFWPP